MSVPTELLEALDAEGQRQASYQARRIGCWCADAETRCDAHRCYAIGWSHGAQTIAAQFADRIVTV